MPTDRMWRDDTTGTRSRPMTTAGALLVGTLTAGALAVALGLRTQTVLAGHAGPWRVETAVEAGVTVVGLLVALWLAGSALLATICLLVRGAGASWRSGEQLVHRYAPQVVRKALVLAVGTGIGLGMASGATAAAPAPLPSPTSTSAPVVQADLGWVVTVTPTDPAVPEVDAPVLTGATQVDAPAGAATTPEPTVATSPLGSVSSPETVVVAAGDSLWAIAARHLPPGSTDAQIAAEWPGWYEANAEVIGADPDLIRPGQVLTTPTSVGEVAR